MCTAMACTHISECLQPRSSQGHIQCLGHYPRVVYPTLLLKILAPLLTGLALDLTLTVATPSDGRFQEERCVCLAPGQVILGDHGDNGQSQEQNMSPSWGAERPEKPTTCLS